MKADLGSNAHHVFLLTYRLSHTIHCLTACLLSHPHNARKEEHFWEAPWCSHYGTDTLRECSFSVLDYFHPRGGGELRLATGPPPDTHTPALRSSTKHCVAMPSCPCPALPRGPRPYQATPSVPLLPHLPQDSRPRHPHVRMYSNTPPLPVSLQTHPAMWWCAHMSFVFTCMHTLFRLSVVQHLCSSRIKTQTRLNQNVSYNKVIFWFFLMQDFKVFQIQIISFSIFHALLVGLKHFLILNVFQIHLRSIWGHRNALENKSSFREVQNKRSLTMVTSGKRCTAPVTGLS